MTTEQHALRFLLVTVSGWVHRQQQDVIEYLVEETACSRSNSMGDAFG